MSVRYILSASLIGSLILLGNCNQSNAESLGINFVGAGSAIAPNQGFGYEGHVNWNNAFGEDGTASNLMVSSGQSTLASVSWTSAGAHTGVYHNPANIFDTGAIGPQDGARVVMEGRIRTQNIGFTPQTPPQEAISISVSGLSRVFSSYYAYVYFSSPGDQGDQYNVVFSDGNTSVQQYPVNPFPLVDSQTGNGGRSSGGFYGYDDNFSFIGNTTNFGARGNDSVAVSVGGPGAPVPIQIPADPAFQIFTGDTLTISVADTNNNANNNTGTDWMGIPGAGGNNIGPQANVGVAAIQIVGTLIPIPEPGTLVILGIGMAGAVFVARRMHKA